MMYQTLGKTLALVLLIVGLPVCGIQSATVTFNLTYGSLSNDTLLAHVHIDSVEEFGPGVSSASVRLKYDPQVLTFVDNVNTSDGVFKQWTIFYNAPGGGRFLFTGTGVTPIYSSGEAFSIKFTYLDGYNFNSFTTWLTICSTQVNEEPWVIYYPDVPALLEPVDDSTPVSSYPDFTWSETAGPLGTYKLQYASDSLFTDAVVTHNNISGTSYTLPDSLTDGTYYWHVMAVDFLGRQSSFQSSPFSFTVVNCPLPSWCSATDDSCYFIDVTWQNVSGETGYRVYRSGSPIGTTGADQTSYRDSITGTYSYCVKAYNNYDTSGCSPSDNGTGLTAPPPPSWCSATDDSCYFIDVTWQNVSGETGYRIYRDGSQIGSTGADQTSYRDSITGTYSYCVKAYNNCDTSGCSLSNNGTGLTAPPPPSSVTCVPGCGYIDVSWSPVSGATWYLIYRDGQKVDSVTIPTTSWRDNNPGQSQRCYTVSSKNECGEGSQSSPPRCCTAKYPPAAPDTLYCSDCTDDTAQVDEPYEIWWDSINGASFYRLYENGSLFDVEDSTDTVVVVVHGDANDYYYTLAACNDCDCSDTSNSLRIVVVSPNAVEEIDSPERPEAFALAQNYPNPFNPDTRIEFSLPRASFVTIDVFDILGKRIRRLVYERLSAGYKVVTWDGRDDNGQSVSSGVYFYRIVADDFAESKKMMLIK